MFAALMRLLGLEKRSVGRCILQCAGCGLNRRCQGPWEEALRHKWDIRLLRGFGGEAGLAGHSEVEVEAVQGLTWLG